MQNEPTGASLAFTTSDPIAQQALALMGAGAFQQAQSLLAADDGHADESVRRARAEAAEIIRRVRRDYSLDAAELLARIRQEIPDASPEDLERWRAAGEAQARGVDGQTKFFRREPVNLFRFSAEAKRRRDASAPAKAKPHGWTLIKHLSNVVAAAEGAGESAEVLPIRHRMTYSVTIAPNRPGARAGSLVRCWLPFPQVYRQQRDVTLVRTEQSPEQGPTPRVAPEGTPQRSVYFEQRIVDPAGPIAFGEVFEFASHAYYPKLDDALVEPLPADWNGQCLGERPPHIRFSTEIRQRVAEIVGTETNSLAKVRAIFRWINDNVRYHAEEEYSVIPSFSAACLSRGKGDCGVQAMLFITMCRAAGVPARWQSGWESKRDRWNMHDWAEVYVPPWGWLPCDVSYGIVRYATDPRVRDFYIGHQDSYRLIVNLDYGRELVPPKTSLRSEPADFQVGEIEIDGRNLFYDEWSHEMKIEWLTDEP